MCITDICHFFYFYVALPPGSNLVGDAYFLVAGRACFLKRQTAGNWAVYLR